MHLATCYNYAAHTIYTDGRLYKNGALVGEYATEATAKAQATRRNRAQRATDAAAHQQAIASIWRRTA